MHSSIRIWSDLMIYDHKHWPLLTPIDWLTNIFSPNIFLNLLSGLYEQKLKSEKLYRENLKPFVLGIENRV